MLAYYIESLIKATITILTVETPGSDRSVPSTGIRCRKFIATGIKPL